MIERGEPGERPYQVAAVLLPCRCVKNHNPEPEAVELHHVAKNLVRTPKIEYNRDSQAGWGVFEALPTPRPTNLLRRCVAMSSVYPVQLPLFTFKCCNKLSLIHI